jgi:threonine synthase
MTDGRFVEHCIDCGKVFDHGVFRTRCDHCNGLIDVDYDLEQVKIRLEADEMMERYWDILPIADQANLISSGGGGTPTVHARALGALIGLDRLYLKDETKNPTGTTKDRTAAVVLSYLRELGVVHFTSSATGNSSTAFSVAAINNAPFEHSVFVGSRWHHRLTFPAHPRVHVWILEGGTVNEAIAFSRRWEKEHGIPSEGGFFNLARREGLKLAILEAFDQTGLSFDWYFQGVSTAMGLYGAFKASSQYLGLGRIDHIPRLVGVQESTCAPQVAAYADDSPVLEPRHVVAEPDGLADALLKGNPTDTYPYMYRVMKATRGTFMSVTADQIREARKAVFEYEGIPACNASSTSIAALMKMARAGQLDRRAPILACVTGSDRDPAIYPKRYMKVVKTSANTWEPIGEVVEA